MDCHASLCYDYWECYWVFTIHHRYVNDICYQGGNNKKNRIMFQLQRLQSILWEKITPRKYIHQVKYMQNNTPVFFVSFCVLWNIPQCQYNIPETYMVLSTKRHQRPRIVYNCYPRNVTTFFRYIYWWKIVTTSGHTLFCCFLTCCVMSQQHINNLVNYIVALKSSAIRFNFLLLFGLCEPKQIINTHRKFKWIKYNFGVRNLAADEHRLIHSTGLLCIAE